MRSAITNIGHKIFNSYINYFFYGFKIAILLDLDGFILAEKVNNFWKTVTYHRANSVSFSKSSTSFGILKVKVS